MKGILVVVPCGKRKIWDKKKHPKPGPTAARDAYVGPPFTVNKKYAECFAERWVILSANSDYGFISPEFKIEGPYNVTFKDESTKPITVPKLQDQIRKNGLDSFKTVIGLGGKEYRSRLQEAFAPFAVKVIFPRFVGLPLGKLMHETMQAVESDDPMID